MAKSKNTISELSKLDTAALVKKVSESQKALFDNKQLLLRGEFKDLSFFKKERQAIARMMSLLGKSGVKVVAKAAVESKPAKKVAKKAPKAKAEKVQAEENK